MSVKKQKSLAARLYLYLRIFSRSYPAVVYLGKWTLICALTGILTGTAISGFLLSLNWVSNLREAHLWLIALLPAGGLLIGLLYYYKGLKAEAGNNLLIDAIHDPQQRIPFRMAPFIYIGTITTHLLGGSAGREGTALQIAGALAAPFQKLFRLKEEERQILIISAVAAGFGAAFGTPLAGAIFGMEFFLVGKFRYRALYPAFIAAAIAERMTEYWSVPHTHYVIQHIPELSLMNISYALLAGIIFGIAAAGFSKAMHRMSAAFKSWISYPPLRPFIGGIIVVAAVWLLGSTKYIGLGIPTIAQAFDMPLPAYDFALKMAFTIITLSAGFKGGEVTPLFFIGATLGNALSYFIPLPTGLLAGMGFAAVFGAAANTPLACIVMAMELFGSHSAVYVGITCVVAYLFSGHTGIYGKQMIGEAKNKRFRYQVSRRISEL